MKERPIIFSAPMVRAILDGRKTQTRRVVKPNPDLGFPEKWCDKLKTVDRFAGDYRKYCPYGVPGDRLWVRETFYDDIQPEGRLTSHTDEDFENLYYRADGECCDQIPECQCADVGKPKWRPSIYMPRWASRITLEVTGVRVERLMEITEEDAKAEAPPTPTIRAPDYFTEKGKFAILWNEINEKRGYHFTSNPWVWAVEFKVIR